MINRKTLLLLLSFALVLRLSVNAAQRTIIQQGIADEVLRFHVLANSDSEEDQRVKYLVRDEVLTWIEQEWNGSDTKFAMLEFLAPRLDEIASVADRVLAEEGMAYRAEAELVTCPFPDRTYGDCTFPAGWYEALRIRLGEADGKNWWCVLYPRLCFADSVHAVVEEDQMKQLEEVLTVEEYEALLEQPKKWRISFRWF